MRTPVAIILGDADKVAPPGTNGEVAAALIPGAKLTVLPRVGHYDFLAECTPAGDAAVRSVPTDVPRAATHKAAIDGAIGVIRRDARRGLAACGLRRAHDEAAMLISIGRERNPRRAGRAIG